MKRIKKHDRGARDWPQLNRHRRRAKHQLKIEPLCAFCLAQGKATPARIADHIEPHAGDWNSFRLGALQSLCVQCHNKAKQQIEHRGYSTDIGADGFPIDAAHPFNQGGPLPFHSGK